MCTEPERYLKSGSGVVGGRDIVSAGAHVFVVPEEGHDQIARLHDELYAGVLRPHLREDIAFVPHITIATSDALWCQTYAQQLNETFKPVRGVLESMTLLDVTRTEFESLARFPLGTPSSQPA